jgi:hypothetical protein
LVRTSHEYIWWIVRFNEPCVSNGFLQTALKPVRDYRTLSVMRKMTLFTPCKAMIQTLALHEQYRLIFSQLPAEIQWPIPCMAIHKVPQNNTTLRLSSVCPALLHSLRSMLRSGSGETCKTHMQIIVHILLPNEPPPHLLCSCLG